MLLKIKNNSNEETDHVVLRNYSATALTGKNKGDSFLSNFKDANGNALSSLVEDDKSVIRVDLLKPLKPNEEIAITFDFQTDIPKVKNRFGYTEYDDNLISNYPFVSQVYPFMKMVNGIKIPLYYPERSQTIHRIELFSFYKGSH